MVKTKKQSGWVLLRALGKLAVLLLEAILVFASDERYKPRLTASKAQELYEDGVISEIELARHIYGEK